MNLKDKINAQKFTIFAGISSLSLIISTLSIVKTTKEIHSISNHLEPISVWTKSQNECIEKSFRINGKNTRGIPSKVWSCNGGGN